MPHIFLLMSVTSDYAVILKGNEKDTTTYISLDDEQFSELLDSISGASSSIVSSQKKNTYKVISESAVNYDRVIREIQSNSASVISSFTAYQSVNSDATTSIYNDIYEAQNIQTFFLSLILGLLIAILFFKGLK